MNARPRSSPRPRRSHVVVHNSSGNYQASHGNPCVSSVASTSTLWTERECAAVVVVFLFVGFSVIPLAHTLFQFGSRKQVAISLPSFLFLSLFLSFSLLLFFLRREFKRDRDHLVPCPIPHVALGGGGGGSGRGLGAELGPTFDEATMPLGAACMRFQLLRYCRA